MITRLKIFLFVLTFFQCVSFSQWDPSSVWCIVKVNYDKLSLFAFSNEWMARPIGSLFFITETKFITAHHCLQNLISPDEGYTKCKFIFVSSNGDIIQNYKLTALKPEYDLTIGEISEVGHKIYVWDLSNEYFENELVYNMGYPIKFIENRSIFKIKIENDIVLKDTIYIPVSTNTGNLLKDSSISINVEGVEIKKKKVIRTNYYTTKGYSGGPLISLENNEVIGFMFLTEFFKTNNPLEETFDYYKGKGMAIRIRDVIKFIDE